MQNIPQKNLWDISYLYRNDEKRFVLFFDGYFFCSTPCSTDLFAIGVFTESPYSYIIGFSFFQSFDCYAVLFDFYIFRTLHGFFQGILHLISFCTSYFFNGNDCFSGFFTLYRFHSCFLCCRFCCLKIFLLQSLHLLLHSVSAVLPDFSLLLQDPSLPDPDFLLKYVLL